MLSKKNTGFTNNMKGSETDCYLVVQCYGSLFTCFSIINSFDIRWTVFDHNFMRYLMSLIIFCGTFAWWRWWITKSCFRESKGFLWSNHNICAFHCWCRASSSIILLMKSESTHPKRYFFPAAYSVVRVLLVMLWSDGNWFNMLVVQTL